MVVRCKLRQCLNYEKSGRVGTCGCIVPTILKATKPDSVNCQFYDDDFWKTYNEMKSHGGLHKVILHANNKRTDEEIKKSKPKRRSKRA